MNYINYLQINSAFFGAFFAFIFFVIGELWLSSMRKREKILYELTRAGEYIALNIYYCEQNLIKCHIEKNAKPIRITINRFTLFPMECAIYQKIGGYKVANSIFKFVIRLRAINEDMQTLNGWIKELSDFSRMSMLENRQADLVETMKKNLSDVNSDKRKLSKHLIEIKNDINYISAEIGITIKYVKAYFWTKLYIIIRNKIFKNYRKNEIEKIVKSMNKAKKKTTKKK